MTFARHTRREFLAAAGAMAVAGSGTPSFGAFQQDDASMLIKGKDKRLLVLKKYPAVFETPLNLLADQALTPKNLLFVRNNQQPEDTATVAPSSHTDWAIKLSGGTSREVSVSLAQLREMDMTDYEMVLQCSGNGRSLFSKAALTNGTQWGKGGMGNVRFAGVRLSKVLEANGVEIDAATQFINASGADDPADHVRFATQSVVFGRNRRGGAPAGARARPHRVPTAQKGCSARGGLVAHLTFHFGARHQCGDRVYDHHIDIFQWIIL